METAMVPDNANEGCVGPTSSKAGKASACEGCPNQSACSSGQVSAAAVDDTSSIQSALSNISHIVMILSGKGGVGKSTVACQLAHTLSHRGYSIGVLDVDICGPSVARMLGVHGQEVHRSNSGWTPVYANPNLAVMSISFLLAEEDAAVVWRGPRKNGMIKQFLMETNWGEEEGLDYLIIDTPPGTSDEHISTVQYLQSLKNGTSGCAVVITTPEEVSMADVRKELNFCVKTKMPVVGIVENMASFRTKFLDLKFLKRRNDDDTSTTTTDGYEDNTQAVLTLIREKCPEVLDMVAEADIFPASGGGPRGMAAKFNVPYLGALPLDPNILSSCENGVCFVQSFPDSVGVGPLNALVDKLVKALPVEELDIE